MIKMRCFHFPRLAIEGYACCIKPHSQAAYFQRMGVIEQCGWEVIRDLHLLGPVGSDGSDSVAPVAQT